MESRLILWEIGSLEQRLVNELPLAKDTASRLVVNELGKLEQKGVIYSGRRLLFGLFFISQMIRVNWLVS